MKILITGGAGYLGSVLTRNLLKKHEVIVYDNLMYNQTSLVDLCHHENFTYHYGDVREWSKLKYLVEQVDVIIPLAALVGFPSCEKDKELATSINTTQIQNIVDTMTDEQKILYPNTNSGYGSRTEGMVDETNDLTPISHYGVTKCEAEDSILQESNGIVFRLATVFGVIHIQDVSSAFEFMIENYDKYQGQIFNVGLSDTNINKKELVERIQRQIPNTSITYSDYFEDPDKRNYVVSNEKIESTGWKPQYSLDDGITELIQAYKMIVPQESSRYRNAFPLSYGQSI